MVLQTSLLTWKYTVYVCHRFPSNEKKHLLFLWLQSLSTVILDPKKIKSITISTFSPSIFCEVMEPDATILDFWMFSFKSVFSLSFHLCF